MPETIQYAHGKETWLWYDVKYDLETQGALKDVHIDPLSVTENGCGGKVGNCKFYITWVHEKFLLVSVTEDLPELFEAFAKIVGYRPFCKYISKETGLLTYEWSKVDPQERFISLQQAGEKSLEAVK